MGKIYRREIGAVALTALQDSWSRWVPGNILRDEVEADFAPYADLVDEDGTTELSMTVYLLESDGVRVVVDTGLADQGLPRTAVNDEGQLLDCMDEAGVDPASIDFVVHTHLHFDHVGWNTRPEDGSPVPTFVNAKHVIQRPEWEYWTGEDRGFPGPDYERSLGPLEARGMIELVDAEERELAPGIAALPAFGHTPGHQVVRIDSEGVRAYVLGDACHVVMHVCETGWSDLADVDHVTGDATRAALMQRVDDEGALVIACHFPFPGIGRRTVRDGHCVYEPLE